MALRYGFGSVLVVAIMVVGCSKTSSRPGEKQVKTFPVVGVVEVDGNPEAAVSVTAHPEAETNFDKPLVTFTDEHGKFSFMTYKPGDGLPEGKYKLTFTWHNMFDRSRSDKQKQDKLHGIYADPKASKHEITVESGTPTDLDVIQLSTKDATK
jgi:hypothetical protein